MTPIPFPEANKIFKAPAGFDEAQVAAIPAYLGETRTGSCDGERCVVVAWKPDERELAAIAAGAPIFLTCLGGLPPHFLTTNFTEATNPA
jgi:hypothetical protein